MVSHTWPSGVQPSFGQSPQFIMSLNISPSQSYVNGYKPTNYLRFEKAPTLESVRSSWYGEHGLAVVLFSCT
jgi:hypothetical protein